MVTWRSLVCSVLLLSLEKSNSADLRPCGYWRLHFLKDGCNAICDVVDLNLCIATAATKILICVDVWIIKPRSFR